VNHAAEIKAHAKEDLAGDVVARVIDADIPAPTRELSLCRRP
jgi:hypothetical protein